MFIIDLPFRFIFAFLGFTFGGWIGWLGLILIALKFFHIIGWPWWVVALPLIYGVLYSLYMTIDGALYRLGWKDIGGYARATATDEQLAEAELERFERNRPKIEAELDRVIREIKAKRGTGSGEKE